jgi:hypothetical protein
LAEKGKKWREWIKTEISLCDSCAYAVKKLSEDLMKASGDSGTVSDKMYREVFYMRVDADFREWLVELDPQKCDEQYLNVLRKKIKKIAFALGEEMIDDFGMKAFKGRYMAEKDEKSDKPRHYSAPEAYNYFVYRINKIYERS